VVPAHNKRKGLRVFALGQRLRRFAEHVATAAGAANGQRVRRWFQDKKAVLYTVLADPQMPATSTLLDSPQHHRAETLNDEGVPSSGGSQQAFLGGLAHLYNLMPYQRRAKHPGRCGGKSKAGKVPTRGRLLNLKSSPLEAFDER